MDILNHISKTMRNYICFPYCKTKTFCCEKLNLRCKICYTTKNTKNETSTPVQKSSKHEKEITSYPGPIISSQPRRSDTSTKDSSQININKRNIQLDLCSSTKPHTESPFILAAPCNLPSTSKPNEIKNVTESTSSIAPSDFASISESNKSKSVSETTPPLWPNNIVLKKKTSITDSIERSLIQEQAERKISTRKDRHENKLLYEPLPRIGIDLEPLSLTFYEVYNNSIRFDPIVKVDRIANSSEDFINLRREFLNTTQSHFKVVRIDRVSNIFIFLFYLLKLEEYIIIHEEKNVQECLWKYHGTPYKNIHNICKYNLDWRLHKKTGLFGRGVNFSSISNYASNYCDNTEVRAMIAARVLVCKVCNGNPQMTIPPYCDEKRKIRYDTSQKPDGHVEVKYHDDEFYPEYIIYFTGKTRRNNYKQNYRK